MGVASKLNYQGGWVQKVIVTCFCNHRDDAVFPFEQTISGYEDVHDDYRRYSEAAANGLLTADEVDQLRDYITQRYHGELCLIPHEIPLPLTSGWIRAIRSDFDRTERIDLWKDPGYGLRIPVGMRLTVETEVPTAWR